MIGRSGERRLGISVLAAHDDDDDDDIYIYIYIYNSSNIRPSGQLRLPPFLTLFQESLELCFENFHMILNDPALFGVICLSTLCFTVHFTL